MKTPPIPQIILHEDPHILICHKPPGLPVQSQKINTPDLESSLLTYLISKGEPPYLAVIHRLDQPVEGILVFAKKQSRSQRPKRPGPERKYGKILPCRCQRHTDEKRIPS